MVLQARTKTTLSQDAIIAYVLLNGHDLPCIVPVKRLIFCPLPEGRESVPGLGDNSGLTTK